MFDNGETSSTGGGNGTDPRVAIEARGAARLEDSQLLALVVRRGSNGRDALGVSADVIRFAGGLAALADLTFAELCAVDGFGPAKAAAVLAAFELGRRAIARAAPGERLGSSGDVYRAFFPWMVAERAEVFSCAMVDAKLRLIRMELISRGTLTASIVHPREAFRPAVRNSASGVIFAHNHPSGDPLPSDEDRRITDRLEEVGTILGIPLLDHVIIGADGSYYSFADSGALESHGQGYRGMVLR